MTGNHGEYDFWIVNLDSSGSLRWQKSLGGSASDYAYSMCKTDDGGFIVAGSSGSNDGDVTGNHGGGDYWVTKLITYPTGITSVSPTSPITVYPNPSTGSFYFSGVTEGSTIEVYNMMGQKINTTSPQSSPKGEGITAINLFGRAAGVYFYRVSDQNNTIQTGKLVVE